MLSECAKLEQEIAQAWIEYEQDIYRLLIVPLATYSSQYIHEAEQELKRHESDRAYVESVRKKAESARRDARSADPSIMRHHEAKLAELQGRFDKYGEARCMWHQRRSPSAPRRTLTPA